MLTGSTVRQVITRTPAHLIAKGELAKSINAENGLAQTEDPLKDRMEFSRAHGLRFSMPRSWLAEALYKQLAEGPLMLSALFNLENWIAGKMSPGHMFIIDGMSESLEGPRLHVLDPAPVKKGMRLKITFDKMMAAFPGSTYGVYWKA